MKERIKHMIYEIKTFVYQLVGCKVRTTYAYYYYLCFKELFKKLLKPKKMIAVKWRINPNGDFKFYTEITDDLLYHCSPIFYQGEFNQENNNHDFEIVNKNGVRENDTFIYRPIESFRIITNNNGVDYLCTKDSRYNTLLIDCEILKWFENSQEKSFDREKIINNNQKCILDYGENLLVVLEGNFEITNNILGLNKIDYKNFINRFKIK
jgi:hypothetical protein